MTKGNLSLALSTAALILAAAAGGPAIARAIAPNADKVDGIDAVKSTATVKARKGKLVATSAKTGRLPNNIIATAPNSARLGGFTARQSRHVQLMPGAADLVNGAVLTGGGAIGFPGDETSSKALWVAMLPPDYKAGSMVSVDLVLARAPGSACSVMLSSEGATAPVPTVGQATVPVKFSGNSSEGAVSFVVAPGNLSFAKKTVTLQAASMKPGGYIGFSLERDSGNVLDNCAGDLYLGAALMRY